MKKTISLLFAFLGLIALAALTLTATTQAATSATVNATVTVQNISVSVSDGTVSYGTLAVNSSQDTTASGLSDTQTATNDGNIAEDLQIRGQDTGNWTLAAAAGADQYVHQFSTNAGSSWTALTTNNQLLSDALASSGDQDFDLKITTPTSTSVFTEQTVSVTVVATAN